MKIVQICPYKAPAKDSMGAERMIESLTKGLLYHGHKVVMKIDPDSENSPAPIVQDIPSDADILNFHGWDPDVSPAEYSQYGIPWVVTMHGGGTESDPKWLNSVKNNPHIICVSKFIADRIGCKKYAWSCSDPKDFYYREFKDDYFLWMAGTDWGESKGLFTTINLAKRMGFKLVLAGTGKNQHMIDTIKNMVSGESKIEFVGAVNGHQKSDLLSRAKALILLSRVPDACPLTVSESLLSGTPIIASNAGALPEIVNDKVGFVCEGNVDFARAIAKIGTINPLDCRRHGEDNFSNNVIANKYLQFYKQMLL